MEVEPMEESTNDKLALEMSPISTSVADDQSSSSVQKLPKQRECLDASS